MGLYDCLNKLNEVGATVSSQWVIKGTRIGVKIRTSCAGQRETYSRASLFLWTPVFPPIRLRSVGGPLSPPTSLCAPEGGTEPSEPCDTASVRQDPAGH